MMLLRCLIPFAVVCLSLTLPSVAQEKTFGRRIAELVAPLDAQESVFVVHIDLAKVDASAITEWGIQVAPASDRENAEFTARKIRDFTSEIKVAGALESTIVVCPSRFNSPFSAPGEIAVTIATKPGTAKAVANVIRPLLQEQYFEILERGDTVILALPGRLKALTLDAAPSDSVATAFDAAKSAPIRIIVQIPSDLRRVIRDTLRKLPDHLGGLSGADIADGVSWATISLDMPPNLQIDAEIKTANGGISKSLAKLIDSGVRQLSAIPQSTDPDKIWAGISPSIAAEANKVRISIGGKSGDREAIQTVVAKYLTVQRQIEMVTEHVNRLKQFALAMHNFENAKGRLPTRAIPDAAGKPLLSWRVEILPYIGHAELYSQFKLNEPWDSENNKKLIEKMPPEFVSPLITIKEKGKTPFVVPIAERSMFSGKEGVRFFDITDGTSNTIMLAVADAEHAVVWTKPDDLAIDPKDPTSGLHFNAYDGRKVIYFAIADGSVVGIPRDQLVDKLLPLLTIDGGEVASF